MGSSRGAPGSSTMAACQIVRMPPGCTPAAIVTRFAAAGTASGRSAWPLIIFDCHSSFLAIGDWRILDTSIVSRALGLAGKRSVDDDDDAGCLAVALELSQATAKSAVADTMPINQILDCFIMDSL